ncbi:hypothetical protein C8J57DRAFT_1044626 [Mycena rebaudengoi]|nr:hypothetical protein C8J57DRAFT_1044626 [Mycena rebaudengoi]
MDSPGRFGTIQLLRTTSNVAPPNATTDVVTSFGIDTPSVSFGRDPTCSVRLYYAAVSPLHARVVFSPAGKAFVEVLGEQGMRVDGCGVFPHTGGKGPKTIPLGGGSELEIHGKRFRFVYPPKELRKVLAASPAPNRALRLSMISSAQVFSPRPSADPRQNLRVLQSPMRAPFPRAATNNSHTRMAAPTNNASEDEEHENITLVQGAHPRVVEEARDLVILEDVDLSLSPSPSSPRNAPPAPDAPQPARPTTPARRQSLHRAVLIRSAQRAYADENDSGSEEEDGGSEDEAVAALLGDALSDEDEGGSDDDEPDHQHHDQAGDVTDEDADEDMEAEVVEQPAPRAPTWRKSLERIALWPFRVKREVRAFYFCVSRSFCGDWFFFPRAIYSVRMRVTHSLFLHFCIQTFRLPLPPPPLSPFFSRPPSASLFDPNINIVLRPFSPFLRSSIRPLSPACPDAFIPHRKRSRPSRWSTPTRATSKTNMTMRKTKTKNKTQISPTRRYVLPSLVLFFWFCGSFFPFA